MKYILTLACALFMASCIFEVSSSRKSAPNDEIVLICDPGSLMPHAHGASSCYGECCTWEFEYYNSWCEETWCYDELYCDWQYVEEHCYIY